MKSAAFGLLIAVGVTGQALADRHQRATPSGPVLEATIPFVGCPSFGQVGNIEAPNEVSPSVRLHQNEAQDLAFYKSGDGIAVLAPRGWHCQGASGSGGAVLFVAPVPIRFVDGHWEGLDGPVIEVTYVSGESSGMFEIAELIGRVFPAYRPFARRVWQQTLDLPFPTGVFPKDLLKYKSKTLVEYRTPARTRGLGNFDSSIGANAMPITGAAILLIDPENVSGEVPHLILLSIRLPQELKRLAPAIVGYVENTAEERYGR